MPRVYKPDPGRKRYKRYDENVIKQAVEEYLTGNSSLKTVAAKYNMHTSVLYRHSKGILKSQGGQRALSLETEEYIIQYINVCAEWGYPLDALDLRYLIKMYLDKIGISHKRFKNNLPGPDFVQCFLNRHKDKISQRICQNIKRYRAAVSSEIINMYFEELKKSLVNVPPSNIVNYDETNLADDPGRRKIITKRGTKYPERIMNHSKASISIMMAGSAEGEVLAPYVVYKAQNLYNTWVTQGPRGARYNRSPSGWFDATIFEDWVQTIVIPFFATKTGKKVLIGDNLSSHLSVDMIKLCQEHDIHFIFLPSNSTHLTQPLDVAFFRPMKTAWRQILLKWKKTDGSNETCVPKGCFPKLLKKLMDVIQENAVSNLKAGFKKTGIYPLDPTQVLSRIPTESTDTNRYREAVDDSVLNLLNTMRYGSTGIKEVKRKRKLKVVAGKSFGESTEDYIESEDTPGPSTSKRQRNFEVTPTPSTSKENSRKQTGNLLEKENLLPEETTNVRKSKKGKGIGKKTKKKASAAMVQIQDITGESMEIESAFIDGVNDNIMNINYSILDIMPEVTPDLGTTIQQSFKPIDNIDNLLEKENILPEETKNIRNSIKGKGIGKKTKEKASTSIVQFNDTTEKSIDKINDNRNINDHFLDMPIYFEDYLEFGEELTIENYPLTETLLINPKPASENIEISQNNINQSDHSGELNYQLSNNENQYSVAEVITNQPEHADESNRTEQYSVAQAGNNLLMIKKERTKIIDNKDFFKTCKIICDVKKCKRISPEAPIAFIKKKTVRPKKYYKDDEAILKDLQDNNN